MKKTRKIPILAIILGSLGLAWVLAVVIYTMVLALPRACWGSITCAVIAIAAVEVYLLVFRKDPGIEGAEAGALGTILTIAYFLIIVLLNSIFLVLGWGNFNWILLILNFIVIGAYIFLLFWMERYTARLAKLLAKTEQQAAPSREIARKLSELLAITEDAEVRGKLLKLKENVDYRTGITAAQKEQIDGQLDEIAQLTIGHADRLIILNKIAAAEAVWNMHSNT